MPKSPAHSQRFACAFLQRVTENLWKIFSALQAAALKATTESVVDFSRASDIRDNYRFSRGSWTNRAVALESPFCSNYHCYYHSGLFPRDRWKEESVRKHPRLIKRAWYHYLELDFYRQISWRSMILCARFIVKFNLYRKQKFCKSMIAKGIYFWILYLILWILYHFYISFFFQFYSDHTNEIVDIKFPSYPHTCNCTPVQISIKLIYVFLSNRINFHCCLIPRLFFSSGIIRKPRIRKRETENPAWQ